MTLAPDDVLAGIVAAHPALVGGLDALTVHDAGRGGSAPTRLQSRPGPQIVPQLVPQTDACPVLKVPVHRAPMGKLSGQQPPRTAAAQQIQQSVDDPAAIHRRATPFLGKRQQRFDLLPLRFGQISRVTLGSLHPKPEPNSVQYRKLKIAFSNTLLAAAGRLASIQPHRRIDSKKL